MNLLEADPMTGAKSQWMLWAAVSIGIAAFQFCNVSGISDALVINLYYTGYAMAFFLFTLFIFVNHKQYFISFIAVGLSFSNLVDELFFDPTKFQLNELVFAILLFIFGIERYYKVFTAIAVFIKNNSRRRNERLYKANSDDSNRLNSGGSKTYRRE